MGTDNTFNDIINGEHERSTTAYIYVNQYYK
jgi:hypothetical protein